MSRVAKMMVGGIVGLFVFMAFINAKAEHEVFSQTYRLVPDQPLVVPFKGDRGEGCLKVILWEGFSLCARGCHADDAVSNNRAFADVIVDARILNETRPPLPKKLGEWSFQSESYESGTKRVRVELWLVKCDFSFRSHPSGVPQVTGMSPSVRVTMTEE